ncbi:hypothetical protein GCM10023187_54920 [Nibrella viscosa]|uniref:Uncharacterized protein n=1 Tax=Nibrella viscosa TaxID=1084524 RepID=A0ABP8L1V0_9BACT
MDSQLLFSNNEFEKLVSEVAAKATYVNFCQVIYVGSNLTSHNMVCVKDDEKQYISAWPDWAFQAAKEALIANHKLWIIANEAPFGSNIKQLYIMYRGFPN